MPRLNLLVVLLHLILLCPLMAFSALLRRDSSCQSKCGDVPVPYPFGMGNNSISCFKGPRFKLFCNNSYNPPMLFFSKNSKIPILNISLDGQVRTTMWAAHRCFAKDGTISPGAIRLRISLRDGYKFSNTYNRFTAIGCDTQAFISDFGDKAFQSGCLSMCSDKENVMNECSGIGCCQTAIPSGVDHLNVSLASFYNHTRSWNFSRCSYAFLAEHSWFKFNESDLMNFTTRVEFRFENKASTPVVLDWSVGNVSCSEAPNRRGGGDDEYACGKNTNCYDSNNGPGYLCGCRVGYEGNPYLENGCQDIDECKTRNNTCVWKCINTPGTYTCTCPHGSYGDGKKEGSGCTRSNQQFPVVQFTLGFGLGLLFLLLGVSWIYWGLQKQKLVKLKNKFFQQNGGYLLQQQLASREYPLETMKIFTSEELKKATNNYEETRILGRGGYGTVYEGTLSDNRVVAIKKSKMVDKNQIEQFINEVIILSQINHRNVVKLLGCCLETEVPLLVYEFISNGTLSDHIHHTNEPNNSAFSWSNRLRIAAETAGALAYLHSAASQPIIHRDIKPTNILLDENYTAKVSDFGASRLIALDQTQLSTLVQGTMGYLDPEYFHTSILTEKSDVYSFGVVLVELLTGRTAFSLERPEQERNLGMCFVSSAKENRVLEILDYRVALEATGGQVQEVCELARQCLRLHGEERPTMKEVAMELDGLRRLEKFTSMEHNPEETKYLLNEHGCSSYDSNFGLHSMGNQVTWSLDSGR